MFLMDLHTLKINPLRPMLTQMWSKNVQLWISVAPNFTTTKIWVIIILATANVWRLDSISFLLNLAMYHMTLVKNFWIFLWLYKLTLVPITNPIWIFFYIQEILITFLMVISEFSYNIFFKQKKTQKVLVIFNKFINLSASYCTQV